MGLKLLFRRLIIVGPSRNYEVKFTTGVNVIAGPVMTGKSTTLRLLDHAMGAVRPFDFPEIAKCTHVVVECEVGGETLTIRRSLRNMHSKAELFDAPATDVLEGKTKSTPVSPRQEPGQASISSELMRRLGWGDVKTKTAPKQDASTSSPFSLRDLLSLVYVDQTRISDERDAFREREFYKEIKWKAGVELTFGLYDQTATHLADALSAAEADEARIGRYLDTAREFLDKAEVPAFDAIKAQLQKLETGREELLGRRTRLRAASEEELGESLSLVRQRQQREEEVTAIRARQADLDRTLDQLGRLRVQYDRERAQLQFLEESTRLISSVPVGRCPACLQATEVGDSSGSCYVCHRPLPEQTDSVSVAARLRALRRRITDLEGYIGTLRTTSDSLKTGRSEAEQTIDQLTRALERVQQTTLLPSNRRLAELGESLGLIDRNIAAAREHLFLRERAQGQGSALLAVRERVRTLRTQLAGARAKMADPAETVAEFSRDFRDCLAAMRFPYLDGARIDPETYTPVIREAPYGALSSKGAISLVVTAWHLAILRYSLRRSTLFPMILMLDSPLSHVGRDASDPDFKDQQMVEAFYSLLAELHDADAGNFQIILCDNHPPESVKGLVAAEFTGSPDSGRIGLISDE